MINLNKWQLYTNYRFSLIEEEFNSKKGSREWIHYDPEFSPEGIIGESFIVLKDEEGNILSFILDGATSKEYIYKLIWKG